MATETIGVVETVVGGPAHLVAGATVGPSPASSPSADPTLVRRDAAVTISTAENGPYPVRALVTVVDGSAYQVDRSTIALCRCGGSTNKPFCDGPPTPRSASTTPERAVKASEAEESPCQ